MRQPKHASEQIAQGKSDHDQCHDTNRQRWAGREQQGQVDREAHEADGQFEQPFARQPYAGFRRPGYRPRGAHQHSQNDRDDERLNDGMPEAHGFQFSDGP